MTTMAASPTEYLDLLDRAEERFAAEDWAAAAYLWSQLADANPTVGATWTRLGQARYRCARYREAIDAFERALELGGGAVDEDDTDDNFGWQQAYDIARCHARLGDDEQALAWLDRALELGFRDRAAIGADHAFAALRSDPRFAERAWLGEAEGMPRDEGWRADLALLAGEVRRLHYAPFRAVTEADFDAAVAVLHADIPALPDAAVVVRMMALLRRLGDGHTRVGLAGRPEFSDAPVDLYLFADGLYVTAAAPEHADLVGAEVLAVGGHPVEEVLTRLADVISRDNAMGILADAPDRLRKPAVPHALGLIASPDRLPLTVCGEHGTVREVEVPAAAEQFDDVPPKDWVRVTDSIGGPLPLYLREHGNYWFEHLAADQTVYVRYRKVSEPDGEERLADFWARVFEVLDTHQPQRLVLDLRDNGGGNTFLHAPLFRGLARRPRWHEPRRLFVVTGRRTFSAAMNGVAYLDHRRFDWGAEVVFVGEPTGSRPNFVGETVLVTLPYSKVLVSISDLYWQNSWPMDRRPWIAPTIYRPPTFEAYRAGRDPAVEAVLAYPPA